MLRWALTGTDADKITTIGNAAHDLSSIYETGKETIAQKKDRINNIYDLEGNGTEWTAEVNSTSYRRSRGAYYDYSDTPSYRNNCYPTGTSDRICSRLLLYLK